ncbi:hypothetical protein D6833_12035 [Candidatus Parcubacteria bacterium]|nr:MAG: hypothetical protein D6833_12035 [Candidatus Parcubacteria bacterium]
MAEPYAILSLLVLAPYEGEAEHLPGGALFAGDYFRAARLEDSLSHRQRFARELEATLRYLQQRFPQRLRVRWVSPWSLRGLWLAWRHRVRRFPAVVFPDGWVAQGEDLRREALRERVAAYLAGSAPEVK